MLQPLLRISQCTKFPKKIKVREDAKDISRHTARSQDVQEFHRLHFEAKVAVDHEEDDVRNLGDINHTGEGVCGAFYECQTSSLRGNNCKWSSGSGKRMLGVSLDEGFDECRFAHSWRPDDSDDDGRRLFRQAIDKRYMEALFFNIVRADSLLG